MSENKVQATTWVGVEVYWGKIGDGKTHHVIKHRLLPALKEGRAVFTNIDFGGDLALSDGTVIQTGLQRFIVGASMFLDRDVSSLVHNVSNSEIYDLLQLKDMDGQLLKFPRGSRFILDEAQMLWPIDGYRAANPLFFKLLTYSRHFDLDFCFITQNPQLLDKRIISTANELIMIKNLWFISTIGKNAYQESHHQTIWAEAHAKSMHKFDQDIFALYRSSFSSVKRQSRLGPNFILIPLIGLLALVGFFFAKRKTVFFQRGVSDSPVSISTTTQTAQNSLIVDVSTPLVTSVAPLSVDERYAQIQAAIAPSALRDAVSDSSDYKCVYFGGSSSSGKICRK